mmetsp:Transcript_8593/g.21691  ORF Transcript_8593/g.21691 Transcript_8593/m.21691 type:complete len:266 (-) Transcript_8593:22-819(-)
MVSRIQQDLGCNFIFGEQRKGKNRQARNSIPGCIRVDPTNQSWDVWQLEVLKHCFDKLCFRSKTIRSANHSFKDRGTNPIPTSAITEQRPPAASTFSALAIVLHTECNHSRAGNQHHTVELTTSASSERAVRIVVHSDLTGGVLSSQEFPYPGTGEFHIARTIHSAHAKTNATHVTELTVRVGQRLQDGRLNSLLGHLLANGILVGWAGFRSSKHHWRGARGCIGCRQSETHGDRLCTTAIDTNHHCCLGPPRCLCCCCCVHVLR